MHDPEDRTMSCEFDPDRLLLKLEIELPGDEARIQPAVDEIMQAIANEQCAGDAHFEIELALLEALANAVHHGCGADPTKTVLVRVACEEDHGMLIIVRDPGEGFDPAKIPSPLTGKNLFFDHGRGIFLINRVMDHVEYRSGGAEIRMRKK